ncbi:DUF6600 domain-containing protein [Pseudorhodoferax soli]|uniref:FecR family protein n=1 Tax=Pseudorhodoferax soli TaxID=545864 RepID=A0A368X859_9BURK|nr:DUF6600 domain-containing protein [Pseudorhodoferax soli]RCW64170.1 hypothetical protein DES41_11677 [Pseudorhodoferax soli]
MAARIWRNWAAAATLAWATAVSLPAGAQQEPPGRAARLSQPDGGVQWSGADGNWQAADPNWPFTAGDSIRVAAGSRAELHAGAHALRLQGPAELGIDALDDNDLRLTLRQGSLNLRVRDMAPDERIEVNTQNLAMLVDRPGEFRVDLEPGSTRVLARAGTATLFGENGESATLAPAQQARYVGRNLSAIAAQGAGPRDALDQWAADRSLAEDRSPSAQHLSREVLGYQELDAHGEWSSTMEYGTVWYPRTTIANWEPYRHGQWRWVDPWGWTWFDDARWGFAPFHYGRWVQIGPRWAWAPGPRGPRQFYAPALVGFAGAPAPRPPNFNRHRTPGTDWFPLAPGQPWRPGFGGNPRDPGRGNVGLPLPAPLRNTQRERPPGPSIATPAPGFQGGRADQERRDRWQRDQEWQQQRRQQQQQQDQNRNEMHQRHNQVRQEQLQRQDQMQQQQRALQEQQMRQMQQLRQQQDQQQRQLQEPQRQQERFMRDQRDQRDQRDHSERREQREQRQDRPQPPRAAPPQDLRQPGERGGRFGNRD